MSASDARIREIRDWLGTQGWPRDCRLEPASADASFRRYFRVWRADGATRVVMDAPPDREDCAPYLKVTSLLAACDVHVPEVAAADLPRGLLLLEDLGNLHMLAGLQRDADAGQLYAAALASLERIQLRGASGAASLAPYDREALLREMQLLPDWYLARHLARSADSEDNALLTQCFEVLVHAALEQPVVLVHRDKQEDNEDKQDEEDTLHWVLSVQAAPSDEPPPHITERSEQVGGRSGLAALLAYRNRK